MGIHDRGYYRDDGTPGALGASPERFRFRGFSAWSVTTWLIVVNVAVHLLANLVPALHLYEFGHLSTYFAYNRLEVWRLVTFQFLHSHTSLLHLGFNMIGLWIFGGIVEEALGRRKYLAFYLVCGIFGGLLFLVLNLAGILLHANIPGVLFEDPRTPLIGASAGVFGVIMACAYIAPNMMVNLLFPPVSLTMKMLAYIYFGIALFNVLVGGSNAGGDAAHVGGALAGAFFVRNSHLLLDFFDVLGDSRKKQGGSRAGRRGKKADRAAQKRASAEAEIDRILAKVKDEGLMSLSEREKKLLAKDTERKRGGGG
ncbi:MAG: rhomboid family intramembrane serine protease [Phycisphaerales bacterium]|nr:rhomboid family intramembrane serine protease [Phycisphaerales bacterium]